METLYRGSKSGFAKYVLKAILCEGELDMLKLQAQDRTVCAVCMTGRVRSWPGLCRTKEWSRKRPRWYRRQAARAAGGV